MLQSHYKNPYRKLQWSLLHSRQSNPIQWREFKVKSNALQWVANLMWVCVCVCRIDCMNWIIYLHSLFNLYPAQKRFTDMIRLLSCQCAFVHRIPCITCVLVCLCACVLKVHPSQMMSICECARDKTEIKARVWTNSSSTTTTSKRDQSEWYSRKKAQQSHQFGIHLNGMTRIYETNDDNKTSTIKCNEECLACCELLLCKRQRWNFKKRTHFSVVFVWWFFFSA